MTPGVSIRTLDVKAMSDADIAAVNDFQNAMKLEARPEDPPTPVDEFAALVRNIPSFVEVNAWLAEDPGGLLVAAAQTLTFTTGENEHLLDVNISVLPDHRGRGTAWDLLALVVDSAESGGKTVLMGTTNERVPAGAAFCQRIGAEPGLNAHTNRLVLADVDRSLVLRWIDEGPVRAEGYELVGFDGRCPDELVDDVAEVLNVMNDAPRDDLQMEDHHFDAEQLREQEKMLEAQGVEHWWLFARHKESGEFAGLTDVSWSASQPDTVFQGNTGVRPDHRGHALGKWLKAVMLDRILRERPQAQDVRTGNADSNDAMLGINRELGFAPYIASTTWQVDVATARSCLSARISQA